MNKKILIGALLGTMMLCVGLHGCGGADARKARAMERGHTFLEEGNFQKARIEFNNALQITPNDADARYFAAVAAEKAGDLRAAAQGYQSALNVDAAHALAVAALARLYAFSGAPQQALDLVEPVLATQPDHPDLLVVRAAAELALGREQQAFDDANAVLAKAPNQEYAVALLAGIYRGRGENTEAADLINRVLDSGTESVDLRTVLAQLYLDTGDNARAEEQLKKIVESRPSELQYRQRLVAFYASTGRAEEAEKTLRDLVGLDPKSTDYKFALVNYLATQKSFDIAEQQLRSFLEQNPKDFPLRLATGQFYEAHNMTAEAERIYKEVIAADGFESSGLGARNRLATLAIRGSRIDEAKRLIGEVLAENPRDNDALVLRASLALAANQPLDAITDLRAVLRDRPDSSPILQTLARAHVQNNEPDLAREQYRRAIVADPANKEIRNEFGDYLLRTGSADEALKVLDSVLADDPQDLMALELKYRAVSSGGDAKTADEVAAKIVASHPESPLGYFFQGLLRENAGDLAAARAGYEASLEKAPRGAEPLGAIVRVMLRGGQQDEARKYLADVVAKFPDHTVALNLLAEVTLGNRDFDGALALLDQALKVDPSWWVPYRTKAYVQLAKGAREDAIASYVAGMAATANAPSLGVDLAQLYEGAQQPERAIDVYQKLHDTNPSSEPLANNLAMLLSTYREDGASYERAHDLVRGFRNSDNPAYLNTYGWVRYRQGQLDEAITYLRRAALAVPNNAQMHYHLALALLANGDSAQGRVELEKALQSPQPFPGREAAQKTLQSLSKTQG